MAISLVQSKVVVVNGSDSTTLTFNSTPASGNLIVVAFSTFGATTTASVSDNKGNTYTQARRRDISANNEGVWLYYSPNVTSSATFTVTVNPGGASADITLVIAEFSGADTASPLDQSNDGGGDSTTPSSGSVTTAQDGELYVGVLVHSNTNRTLTEGSGWSLIQENEGGTSNIPISVIFRTAAAGTYDANWTIGTSSSTYAALIASFKAGGPQSPYGELMNQPYGGDEFAFKTSNIDGTRPAGGIGTSVTPGNNTKGSWVQLLTALAYEVIDVEVHINSGNTSAAARDILVDIGYDPAGGSSYSVLIPDLLGSCAGTLTDIGPCVYHFPLKIPAGATVAARAAVNNATVGTVRVIIHVKGRPAHPAMHKVGTYVVAVGITSASSSGTAITAGTTSDGTWTSLGSPSKPAWHWQLGFGVNDSTMTALAYFGDLSVGDGTNFSVIIKDMLWRTDSSERSSFYNPSSGCEKYVGTSGVLYARLQCSGTADASLSMAAYGVGGGN